MRRIHKSWTLALGLLAFAATEAPACFSIGAYGGLTNAALELPGTPINIGASGQTATANIDCGIISTDKVRISAFAEYSWILGNLNDIGVDNDLSIGARVGYMASPYAQFYLHGAWSRLFTSFGDIDGWKVGPGVQIALAGTPFDLDMRASWGRYDISGLTSGDIDAERIEGRVGLVYKFPALGKAINLKP